MIEKEKRKDKRFNARLIYIPFVMIAAVLLFAQCDSTSTKSVPAPNFRFPDLDGKYVSLDDYRGKVVLVNIWATWCPPCVAETPALEKLNNMFRDDDFKLLAVSIDESGERVVEQFMKKHNLTFPVLVDPNRSIMKLYGATAVPESFIVRKDGIIDRKVIGAIDWSDPKMIEYFRKLIQE